MTFLKKIFTILLLIFITSSIAQERQKAEFGKPTQEDFALISYPKDPEAAGVVLFESCKYSVEEVGDYVRLIKEVHKKTKVFNAKKIEQTEVNIPFYRDKNTKEKISEVIAITHNGDLKNYVKTSDMFNVDDSENWTRKTFTFPNIKDASILEYKYRIESPYYSRLSGWEFQGDLPKIYSELYTKIPGNFLYNRALIGTHKLLINTNKIKKNCFHLDGWGMTAGCEISIYAMEHVPAFKEEEHMLSISNYMAKIEFELKEIIDFRGSKTKYTKEWKDVDKEFRYDKDMGRQLRNKSFITSKLPEEILAIDDPLNKAKALYTFIQNHFNWNNKYRVRSEIRVKNAFNQKSGNIAEINLALINALQAANLEAKLVLLSTRSNGLPKTVFPVLTDFNYVIALLTVNNTNYFLDATDKINPFGVLPFQALNGQGRVMDFKNGSYWLLLEPYKKNTHYVNTQLTVDDEGLITGKANEISTGYIAMDRRKKIKNMTSETYINNKKNTSEDIEITNYTIENRNAIEKPIKESYQIALDPETVGGKIFFNPFFMETYFSKNPFKKDTRTYPINFGYPVTNTYLISIDLGEQYQVAELPKNKIIKLQNGAGECSVVYTAKNQKINLRFNLKLNKFHFTVEEYQNLKEFFSQVINIQTKEPIVLEKL